MAGILDTLSASLTPEVTGQLSKALGVEETQLSQGLGAAAPTVLASLSKSAGSPDGAEALMKSLPQDTEGDFLGNLIGSLTGGKGGTQADMMNDLLGTGVNAIGGTLSEKLGFDVRPILRAATPMIVGLIVKAISQQKADAPGLASMLKSESDAYLNDPANQEVAGLVSSALEAGDQATALRATFDDDEWKKVRMAPMAAVYLVATASPSGEKGQVEELAAAVGAVEEAVKTAAPTSLIGTAFGGGLTGDELDTLSQEAPPKDRILSVISDGRLIVAQKSPTDAVQYRDMLLNVAQKTAEAAKEGGFLGIGGTLVTREEQAAIDEIKGALS